MPESLLGCEEEVHGWVSSLVWEYANKNCSGPSQSLFKLFRRLEAFSANLSFTDWATKFMSIHCYHSSLGTETHQQEIATVLQNNHETLLRLSASRLPRAEKEKRHVSVFAYHVLEYFHPMSTWQVGCQRREEGCGRFFARERGQTASLHQVGVALASFGVGGARSTLVHPKLLLYHLVCFNVSMFEHPATETP